ncbi:MAG TPA: NAD(P)/FAD-dependent oxidoreductase [Verrucomicrobiae bacterium]|nr:NAD(P)/FAD-dependent oxidoreductase [Verrucomicrobiae bacterium]
MTYDVAIIGAGVVGCALFRRFCLGGARTLLIEKGGDILSGASKGNSAMFHTGYDAPSGSLELACIRAGYDEYLAIRQSLNLPLLHTGGLLVAWNEAEQAKLPAIAEQARVNGVTDASLIDGAELHRREPNLAPEARAAVVIPGEHIMDPWSPSLAYVLQGIAHGGEVRRATEVQGGDLANSLWTLRTTNGPVQARVVINAAGNYGDLVENIARPSPFAVKPRKGQFVVFDKPACRLINSSILPVPTERTKGVMMCRTIFGNMIVGPTAEDQDDRADASVTQDALRNLIEQGCRRVPLLADQTVTAVYAGLRPATQFKDYQIEALPDRNWISASGIRSTGLTGALGIAQHVAGLHGKHFGALQEPNAQAAIPMPNLAEHLPRPYEQPGAGEIVCHCELVTRSEIDAALQGPLPAGDLGGLRRRTRCMMGRCQGFYCSARVFELAQGKLPGIPASADAA